MEKSGSRPKRRLGTTLTLPAGGIRIVAVWDPSKVQAPVRFRYPAPFFAQEEWPFVTSCEEGHSNFALSQRRASNGSARYYEVLRTYNERMSVLRSFLAIRSFSGLRSRYFGGLVDRRAGY